MSLKKIFFTSDLHLGHANCLVFDKRPFKDLDHMHKVLINNFNAIVPNDGITYFLGDVGLGASQQETLDIILQLHGTKILVLGNHDKGMNAMYGCGFDAVMYGAVLFIAGQRVTMSHCPLMGVYREDTSNMAGSHEHENWHGESREMSAKKFSFTDEGQFHLSGHIHSPNGGKSTKTLNRQYDVGVVANGYRPVAISAIESWIAGEVKANG